MSGIEHHALDLTRARLFLRSLQAQVNNESKGLREVEHPVIHLLAKIENKSGRILLFAHTHSLHEARRGEHSLALVTCVLNVHEESRSAVAGPFQNPHLKLGRMSHVNHDSCRSFGTKWLHFRDLGRMVQGGSEDLGNHYIVGGRFM
jgi:hypothetical protein